MKNIYVDVQNVKDDPVLAEKALKFVEGDANGASALFIGTVRNRNAGRDVLGVDYNIFEPLAKASFEEICKEAQEKWGRGLKLYVVHGKGYLDVGGISIVIAVASPHREEAFSACRYVIEEIKHRSPVWKQEYYIDGKSDWVEGHALCSHK